VQAIQEEGQELLAVLLPVAAENVAEAADFGLEAPGSDVLYSNLSGKEGRLRWISRRSLPGSIDWNHEYVKYNTHIEFKSAAGNAGRWPAHTTFTFQIDPIRAANASANSPFCPKGFVLLRSSMKRPERKHCMSGTVWSRHCRALFM